MLDNKKAQVQRPRAVKPVEPPHIDWSLLLADLKRNGCSLYRLAELVGVKYSTAQRWRRPRTDIGYGYGRSIILLHSAYCGAGLTLQRLTEAEASAYTSPA